MNPAVNDRTAPVVIVGAGPAGLATSWHLRGLGVSHVVLERDAVGATWRSARWDSFSLITPTWSVRLPGRRQTADEGGFLEKQQFVDMLSAYAREADLPVRSGVDVRSLRPDGEGYVLATSEGDWSARVVVIACGGLRLPRVPAGISPPSGVTALHAVDYRSPDRLPPGAVLVVGSAQSGTRISDDLRRAGRRVFLSTGAGGGVPRRHRGRDVFEWLRDTGSLELPTEQAPEPMRRAPQPMVSDADDGRTSALRQLDQNGVTLFGRLTAVRDGRFVFADDLAHNLRAADAQAARFRRQVDQYLQDHPEQRAAPAPPDTDDAAYDGDRAAPTELDAAAEGVSTLLWCTGMRPDTAWLPDDLLDERGTPRHERGVTPLAGVFAVGFPWLTHRASGILYGIGTDAARVAEQARGHLGHRL
ncbi:hypothetical protein QR77_24720 [Streptomyces sp. 150FB]|nr:hypothetical protein QR77_24720 [Streptomyces sp. 150FB]